MRSHPWLESISQVAHGHISGALLSPLAPQPDSQSCEDDEGQDADPERNADVSRSHLHTEEDPEQLGESNEPEEDRDDKRCWPIVHPNLLGPALENGSGEESMAVWIAAAAGRAIAGVVPGIARPGLVGDHCGSEGWVLVGVV